MILFVGFDWFQSDKLKHACQKKQAMIVLEGFFLNTLLDILNASTNGKFFSFWATEWQTDSVTVPNPLVIPRAAITLHNYSNWATAGDSSSCLFPVGLDNQTLA